MCTQKCFASQKGSTERLRRDAEQYNAGVLQWKREQGWFIQFVRMNTYEKHID